MQSLTDSFSFHSHFFFFSSLTISLSIFLRPIFCLALAKTMHREGTAVGFAPFHFLSSHLTTHHIDCHFTHFACFGFHKFLQFFVIASGNNSIFCFADYPKFYYAIKWKETNELEHYMFVCRIRHNWNKQIYRNSFRFVYSEFLIGRLSHNLRTLHPTDIEEIKIWTKCTACCWTLTRNLRNSYVVCILATRDGLWCIRQFIYSLFNYSDVVLNYLVLIRFCVSIAVLKYSKAYLMCSLLLLYSDFWLANRVAKRNFDQWSEDKWKCVRWVCNRILYMNTYSILDFV